nr:ribonuclease H-like domain, reverse transcriptase, RNA-dependent DNA polymerase [Tanacetum cinerariifolium]
MLLSHDLAVLDVLAGSVLLLFGSDNKSDDASVHNEAINTQQQPNIQPQIITTVSNNNAKFSYLKKDEYEVWAMKIKYWITNNDINIWKSIPDDHVADFHYMDDARDIWNAVKARGIAQRVALTLKTKGVLELLSFDDLYYKLKTFEVDVKGYSTFSSSQSARPSHSAFVSATSTSKKMSYRDSPNYSSTTTYYVPSNSKTGSHRSDMKEMDLKWKMAMLSVRVYKFEQKAGRKIDFDKKESNRTKVGLGFTNCISKNELGCDDYAFSVFTTTSEDVEGGPVFYRFTKTDSMKAVPPPLSRDYTSLSDHIV